MVSKVLIVVALVITLLGVAGVKEKSIKKRVNYLLLAVVGSVGIAFAQLGEYGLISGIQQIIFKGLGFLFFWLIVSGVCKKNELKELSDLNGVRDDMPYVWGILVALSMFVIGFPGTGSFIGMIYAQMGYMYAQAGVMPYAGMIGNIAGLLISSMLIFPMLKEAFIAKSIVMDKEDSVVQTDTDGRKMFQAPAKMLLVAAMIFVAAMAVLSVWHSVMADIVSKLVNAILG